MWASGIFLLIGLPLAMLRRHWEIVAFCIPLVAYLGMYAFFGFAIDRYGLPAFPVGMALGAYLVSQAINMFAKKNRKIPEDSKSQVS